MDSRAVILDDAITAGRTTASGFLGRNGAIFEKGPKIAHSRTNHILGVALDKNVELR